MVGAAVNCTIAACTWLRGFYTSSTNTAHVASLYGGFVVADHVAMLPTLPLSLNFYNFG
jgi:hypothetical protein